jgi:hypothetical protein
MDVHQADLAKHLGTNEHLLQMQKLQKKDAKRQDVPVPGQAVPPMPA